MSKQPRQTVRKKIRINEEKSIPGTRRPAASAAGEGPAHSVPLITGRKSLRAQEQDEAAVPAV